MAKGQALAWKELRVGILVITSIVLLAAAIFFIGGDSGFFTPKYNIVVYFQTASGVHSGAVVLLDGVTIGNVSTVKLAEKASPKHLVDISLRINKSYHSLIREDSKVSIGQVGVLGDQQVEITRGTPAQPEIADGGTIQGVEVSDIKKIISGTNDVVANLGTLTDQIGDLLGKINNGHGTVGLLLNDPGVYNKMNSTVEEVNNLVKDVRGGKGSLGKLLTNDDLVTNATSSIERLNRSLDRLDSVIAKVDHGDGTIAKFLNDPSLYNDADKFITKGNSVMDRIERGEGTLGKLSKDETVYNDMHTTLSRTNALLSSVENGEGSLGKLVKDSALYNSLTQTSSELQKLMYDFRQNPKKYLTINFRLF